MSANDKRDGERGEMAGRLPSLEEQTPGMDTAQVRQTDADAEAFFGKGQGTEDQSAVVQGTGEAEDPDEFARAAGRGEGADEGTPPGGDLRTVYQNEREPGEATPTKP